MSDQVRDLQDTVVAVTGATAGIGRATARLLVERGARVALLGRRQERLDELVARAGRRPGGRGGRGRRRPRGQRPAGRAGAVPGSAGWTAWWPTPASARTAGS